MTAATLGSRIGNLIAFQAGWFACVLSAARDLPWAGVAAALAIVAWHLLHSPDRAREGTIVLATTITGLAWDSLLATSGWIGYRGAVVLPGLPPPWIAALWMLFATTLNGSLAWLQGRPVAGLLLGAVGGPAAYLAGEALGALAFTDKASALVALAVGWGVLVPLLVASASPPARDVAAPGGTANGDASHA